MSKDFTLSLNQSIAIECQSAHAGIIYNHIQYWLRVNAKNPRCHIDGKVWMYESQQAISDFFGFMTRREIKYAFDKLIKKGFIQAGNFNKNKFDRTSWYTIIDDDFQKVLSNMRFCKMDEAELSNGMDKIVQSYKEEIRIEDIEKELLQAAPVVVISSPLSTLKLSSSLKKRLTETYSAETLKLWVDRRLKWKSNPNDQSAILTIEKRRDNWTDFETKEQLEKKNTDYLKTLSSLDGKMMKNYHIVTGTDYIEFTGGANFCRVFKTTEVDFMEKVSDLLTTLDHFEL